MNYYITRSISNTNHLFEKRRPSKKKDVDQKNNQDNYRTRTNKYTPRTIILIKLYSSWNQDNDLFTSICQHLCLFVTEYCLMQYAFIPFNCKIS